jgi:RNA polymerase sigma factor (sigma-70 family)
VELNPVAGHAKDRGEEGSDPPEEIDGLILLKCIEGDPLAVRSFVNHYKGPLFLYLSRSHGCGPHVEALAMSAFAEAIVSFHKYKPGKTKPFLWLVRRARAALKRNGPYSSRKQLQHLDANGGEALSLRARDDPEENTYQIQRRRHIERAFKVLSQIERDTLALWMMGVPDSEIGETLLCPPATVRGRVQRARQKLEKHLSIYQSEVRDE